MATSISDALKEQLPDILAINNAALPNVNRLEMKQLEKLFAQSCYFRVAHWEGKLAAFLVAMRPDQDYHSLNFAWFRDHYENFVYIDRVVVRKEFRGLGVGNVFYADVQSFAEQISPYLTCEVNLEPPNDVSLLFHGTHGFEEVGQQTTENGAKRVSLLAKPLPPYEFVRQRYG